MFLYICYFLFMSYNIIFTKIKYYTKVNKYSTVHNILDYMYVPNVKELLLKKRNKTIQI